MPSRTPHICTTPGCNRAASAGTKCGACGKRKAFRRVAVVDNRLTTMSSQEATWRIAQWKRDKPELLEADRLRGLPAYRRLRTWLKAVHPLCYNPLGFHRGYLPKAEQVHHIRAVKDCPDEAFDALNCVPLCKTCHAKVEARERTQSLPASTWEQWRAFIGEVMA